MEGHQPQNSVDETAAQRQARIRRERREAKIKAGGSARLDKITSVSGRPAELAAAPESLQRTATDNAADPDEVDISSRSYTGAHALNNPPASAEDDIRRLLRSPANNASRQQDGEAGLFGSGGGNDPMTRMLQQLIGESMTVGGGGGRGGQEGIRDPGGLPPGLAAMLGGVEGVGPEQGLGLGEKPPSDRSGYAWRIAHALSALGLGVYMVLMTAFNGAEFSRRGDGKAVRNESGIQFFWAFATAQLVLQSTRYFLERSGAPPRNGGWLSMAAGILPEPWRGWALLLSRYSAIYSTVVQDAMVVVFVLGCVAWWVGEVA